MGLVPIFLVTFLRSLNLVPRVYSAILKLVAEKIGSEVAHLFLISLI